MIQPQTTSGALRGRLTHIITIITASLLLAGCATTGKFVQTYPGPSRERNEVAYLGVDRKFLGVRAVVRTVDGKSLGNVFKMNNTKIIELLPGKHDVSVDFVAGNLHSTAPLYLDFEVNAGSMYQLRVARTEHTFGQALLVALGGYGHWTAWIEDLDTGDVIAGVPRDTPLKWYEK